MTWTKLTDTWTDDPVLLALSRDDRLLLIESTVYANRVLSDGHIPAVTLRIFTDHPQPDKGMAALVDAGLVDVAADGWQIVDFTRHQRSRSQVEHTRAMTRRRLDNWRKAKQRNAVSNGVGNALPDPTRPERRVGEERRLVETRRRPPPDSLHPLARLGELTHDDTVDSVDSFEIVTPRWEITAEVDTATGSVHHVCLDIPRPCTGIPRTEDDLRRQVPHLDALATVDSHGDHVTVAFRAPGGDDGPGIGHRLGQVADYFARLIEQTEAAS